MHHPCMTFHVQYKTASVAAAGSVSVNIWQLSSAAGVCVLKEPDLLHF